MSKTTKENLMPWKDCLSLMQKVPPPVIANGGILDCAEVHIECDFRKALIYPTLLERQLDDTIKRIRIGTFNYVGRDA